MDTGVETTSLPGLTRLRGRSPFGVAKARQSIIVRKTLEERWMRGSSPRMTI
jgi:hypothetical protein